MAWKKGDPNHPRRGNGPGKGAGWGGEAKGASKSRFVEGELQPMQGKQGTAAVVQAREARLAMLKDHLFTLALEAEREETQLSATVAYLNREEGMPKQIQEIDARVASHVIRAPAKPADAAEWAATYAPKSEDA